MSKTDPTEATDERDAARWKARINRLIDSLDERTAHQNRGLSKQPPESWNPGERHAWCVGFLEGGNVLANGVRTILAAFVKEHGLGDSMMTPEQAMPPTTLFAQAAENLMGRIDCNPNDRESIRQFLIEFAEHVLWHTTPAAGSTIKKYKERSITEIVLVLPDMEEML